MEGDGEPSAQNDMVVCPAVASEHRRQLVDCAMCIGETIYTDLGGHEASCNLMLRDARFLNPFSPLPPPIHAKRC